MSTGHIEQAHIFWSAEGRADTYDLETHTKEAQEF